MDTALVIALERADPVIKISTANSDEIIEHGQLLEFIVERPVWPLKRPGPLDFVTRNARDRLPLQGDAKLPGGGMQPLRHGQRFVDLSAGDSSDSKRKQH